jgi:AmiR/NasT family two-component response regulator
VDEWEAATNRMTVWMAVGILIGHAGLSSADALATLRGYAFARNAALEDIAEDMTTRRLKPEAVFVID